MVTRQSSLPTIPTSSFQQTTRYQYERADERQVLVWRQDNNLKLNGTKSKEIVFTGRGAHNKSVTLPLHWLDIRQVHSITAFVTDCHCDTNSITVLGVVLKDKLTATDHVSSLLTSCPSSLYAMRVLRDHGLPASSLQDVFHATVIAKLIYGAPAWSGLCSASDRTRLDAFLRHSKRYGYCSEDIATIRTCALQQMNLYSSVSSKTNYTY